MTIFITNEISDAAILTEIGKRLRDRRIKEGLTQKDTACQAGVATGTVKNLESGKAGSLPSLVAILRALNAIDQLGSLLSAEPTMSPLYALKQQGKARQRVRKPRHE